MHFLPKNKELDDDNAQKDNAQHWILLQNIVETAGGGIYGWSQLVDEDLTQLHLLWLSVYCNIRNSGTS